MRYQPKDPVPRARAPLALWGPGPVRVALSAAVASAIGLLPAVLAPSPAQAASTVLSIANASGNEGGNVSFTLVYTGSSTVTYNLATAAGTATDTTDYTTAPSDTSYQFTGPGSHVVTVAAATDSLAEGPETFTLTATNAAMGMSSDTVSATGTIIDANPQFYLTAPGTVSEAKVPGVGNNPATSRTVAVTASLTKAFGSTVTIAVASTDDTAVSTGTSATKDFTALATNIVIAAGETSGTASVTINDDAWDEDDLQYFTVTGTSTDASVLTTGANTVRIGIQDDDATPAVSMGNAGNVTEGNPMIFPLSLTGGSEKTVTAQVTTANGPTGGGLLSATAGSDYTALTNSQVSFAPGTTSALALVTTTDDSLIEGSPEMLSATVSNPQNATLGATVSGTGGINDNETAPTATLTPTSLPEGSSGDAAKEFTVTLNNGNSTVPVKIDYAFSGGTATAGVDYKGTSGSVTIAPGQTTAKIPVTIVGDTIYEPGGETFNVVLSSSDATISNPGPTAITIAEGADDVAPTWNVGDVTLKEGNTGTTVAQIPITLSGPTNADVTFALSGGALADLGTTQAAGAGAGSDDYDLPGTTSVTIPAGSTSGHLDVTVKGDAVFEPDEKATATFTTGSANVSSSTTGVQHSSTLTIQNDDAAPTVTFNGGSGYEGQSLKVTATVNGVSQTAYTLAFTVAGSGTGTNTAIAGTDYDIPGAIANLVVARGETGRTFATMGNPNLADLATIYLDPDTIDEPTETFSVTATEVGGPTGFVTSTGTYKITDDPDDLPPSVSVSDESIKEWEKSVDVHVSLAFTGDTTATTQTVTVPYWTENGSAKSGDDYTTTKGTLSFAPGETSKTINVPIINDFDKEGNENFFVKLGTPGPSGATITKGTGEVTILANDQDATPPPGAPTISAPAKRVGAGSVTVTGKAGADKKVEIWGAPVGSDLDYITMVTADHSGNYSYSRSISTGYKFATQSESLNSAIVTVQVEQDPAFTATSTAKGTVSLSVTGNPKGGGQKVTVQKLVNGKWTNAWTGTTTGMNPWKTTVKVAGGTKLTLRASIAGNAAQGILIGYSDSKVVTVKK
jgi:hypothetical protein